MHNSGAFLFMHLWIRTLYQVHDFISADIDFIKEIYLLCISKYFVMSKEYLDDLKEIKDIMNRSTRFISLSGISGILAGLIALLGLYCAHSLFYKKLEPPGLYAIKAGRARYTCAAWHCLLYPVPCDQPSCFTDREENKNHESKSLEQAKQNARD